MTEHRIELVNGELDGTNTSTQSAELTAILGEDEATRTFYEETKALFGTLGGIPEAEPPAELQERIMDSISREAAATAASAASSPGIMASVQRFFQPVLSKPAWAVGYAFAAGLLVGVATLNIVEVGDLQENAAVQGTMGQSNSRLLDEASLQVGDIAVDLATVGLGKEVMLDVTISGEGDSTVQIQATNDSRARTSITASGAGHFTVSLDKLDDLVVTVTSAGQEASVRLLTSPA
jgi:hypothetical protein